MSVFRWVVGFDVRQHVKCARVPIDIDGTGRSYMGVDADCWEHPEGYEQFVEGHGWKGANCTLWSLFSEAGAVAERFGGDVLAVELWSQTDHQAKGVGEVTGWAGGLYLDEARPRHLDSTWQRIGFDVADLFLKSVPCGLFYPNDCGEETLNSETGLFDSFEDADACREWVDQVVPEHAPFYVFAVYVRREIPVVCPPKVKTRYDESSGPTSEES